MRRYCVFLIVLSVFLLDRWTKATIVQKVAFDENIFICPFFSIVHVRNFGGVFGVMNDLSHGKWFFTFVPIVVSAFVLYFLIKEKAFSMTALSLSLILGGAIGNIYDRITNGFVIDFLDLHIGSYHWPAFNVADVSISCGMILFLLVTLRRGQHD